MIHVGIDLHSRNMTLVALNDNAKLVVEEKLTTTPANLAQFFGRFTDPVQAVVECKELAKIVWHMLSKQEDYKGFKGRMTRVTTQTYWPQPISSNA